MRLENVNEDKTVVSYRVEFQTEFSDRWNFVKQFKSLAQAQKRAAEFKHISPNTTKIRIIKYIQITETINTEYGEVDHDR